MKCWQTRNLGVAVTLWVTLTFEDRLWILLWRYYSGVWFSRVET